MWAYSGVDFDLGGIFIADPDVIYISRATVRLGGTTAFAVPTRIRLLMQVQGSDPN